MCHLILFKTVNMSILIFLLMLVGCWASCRNIFISDPRDTRSSPISPESNRSKAKTIRAPARPDAQIAPRWGSQHWDAGRVKRGRPPKHSDFTKMKAIIEAENRRGAIERLISHLKFQSRPSLVKATHYRKHCRHHRFCACECQSWPYLV